MGSLRRRPFHRGQPAWWFRPKVLRSTYVTSDVLFDPKHLGSSRQPPFRNRFSRPCDGDLPSRTYLLRQSNLFSRATRSLWSYTKSHYVVQTPKTSLYTRWNIDPIFSCKVEMGHKGRFSLEPKLRSHGTGPLDGFPTPRTKILVYLWENRGR